VRTSRSLTRAAWLLPAFAAFALLAPAAASAATIGAARSPGHGSLAGQVALQGRITDLRGYGVAGARVMLYAWPGDWPGKRVLHAGETVPVRLVGSAVSAAGGQYAIRVSAPAALKASAVGGIVNLQARVPGARAGTGFFAFSLRIRATTAGPVLARLWTPKGAATVAQEAVLRVSMGPRVPSDFCYIQHTQFDKSYKNEWAKVDETFMRDSDMSATASFDVNQSTTFGVGVSASNAYGSFSDSGTFSWGNDFTTNFNPYNGPSSQSYQSQYVPGDYNYYYSPGYCLGNYFTQPDNQTQGHQVTSAGSTPNATHCAPENGVHSIVVNKTQAATISAGMTISEIGFNASTQTGWSNTDTITYTNNNRTNWNLCGLNSLPGVGNPGVLVAD
jgi:hypothetical protein